MESANEAVRIVAAQFQSRAGYDIVEPAFLEGGKPDLADAVAKLSAHGVEKIVVIPYFLTLGLHLQRDLPRLISDIETANPGVHIEVTAPLDGHPAMVEALLDRAQSIR